MQKCTIHLQTLRSFERVVWCRESVSPPGLWNTGDVELWTAAVTQGWPVTLEVSITVHTPDLSRWQWERESERHWLQPQRTTSQTTRLDVQLPTGQLYNDKHLSFFHATGFTLHFAFLFDFVKTCLDNWLFDQIRSQLVKLSAHFTKCSHYSRSSVHKLINSCLRTWPSSTELWLCEAYFCKCHCKLKIILLCNRHFWLML